MIKKFIISAIIFCPLIINAQSINFTNGAVTYSFPADVAGDMTFSGEEITVADRKFALEEWSHININDDSIDANSVIIEYTGERASVTIAGNIA